MSGRGTTPAESPNIVIVLADDLGYGDTGCYGARPEHVRTPHIDGLARDGVRFLDAHSPSSVCTPSRYNLMTGRYAWRTWAFTGTIWANDPCLIEPDRPTLASMLRDVGYETGIVGKWHLGFGSAEDEDWDPALGPDYNRPLTRGPLTCGFDSYFGVPHTGQLPHVYIRDDMVCDLESGDPIRMVRDPDPVFDGDHLTRRRDVTPWLTTEGGASAEYDNSQVAVELTREAVAFIERDREAPFLLYFAHRNVHAEIDPHPDFRGTSGIGEYGDYIHELDWSVGEVLVALDRRGVRENTIVVFTSDNGATEYHRPVRFVDYNGHAANGGLRGQKTEVYEGGHRIPFIVRWPERVAAGTTSDHVVALTDVMATIADLLGLELPERASPDGVTFARVVTEGDDALPSRRPLIHDSMLFPTFAIRSGDWKLILGPNGGGLDGFLETAPADRRASPGQLFDLRADPAEENDRFAHEPARVAELVAEFRAEIAGSRVTLPTSFEPRALPLPPVRRRAE